MGRPREISDHEILASARAAFLEAGPTVSAAAIARRLNISEGTLFNRFGTKEDLLRQALGLPEAHWTDLLIDDAEDLHAHLVLIATTVLQFFAEVMPAMTLLRAAGIHPNETDAEHKECAPRRHHQSLSVWLEREQAKGRLLHRSPQVRAQALLGSLHAHAMMRHIWGETMVDVDDETYARGLIDTLFCELSEGSEDQNE